MTFQELAPTSIHRVARTWHTDTSHASRCHCGTVGIADTPAGARHDMERRCHLADLTATMTAAEIVAMPGRTLHDVPGDA